MLLLTTSQSRRNFASMENGESKTERVKGSEVFVGGLQQSVTEEMVRELFSNCGEIAEIRMMKDKIGKLKGYCFVRFTTREAAQKAQKEKNGIFLQGKKIGVSPSTDQDRLFLGNLKKEWTQEELQTMVCQTFQDVGSVELAVPLATGNSPHDKKQQNRGFAFVHFTSHTAAARAYRIGNRKDFSLGGKWHPIVDWAQSESEPDPDEMAKVKIAFVGNLPSNAKEDFLRKLFEPFGKLERVAISRKSNVPVGFVHFSKRSELDAAIQELDGKVVDGPDKGPKFKLQVSIAKPADKSRKRSRDESEHVTSGKGGQGKTVPTTLGGAYPLPVAYPGYIDYAPMKNPQLGLNESRELGHKMQIARPLDALPREGNLLGISGVAAPRFSVLDNYNLPHISTDSDLLGYAGYSSLPSLSMIPSLAGAVSSESLLTRMPTGFGDAHSLASYRGYLSSLGLGAGLSGQEAGRPFKFDPFTGEPFKFDPFTGEPLQPSVMTSSRMGGSYF